MSEKTAQDMRKSSAEKIPNSGVSSTYAQETLELPEGAEVNADGVPTYYGLCGDKLIWAISATATCGFALFVRPLSLVVCLARSTLTSSCAGLRSRSHVWDHHWC
jgi:hypothetical protein